MVKGKWLTRQSCKAALVRNWVLIMVAETRLEVSGCWCRLLVHRQSLKILPYPHDHNGLQMSQAEKEGRAEVFLACRLLAPIVQLSRRPTPQQARCDGLPRSVRGGKGAFSLFRARCVALDNGILPPWGLYLPREGNSLQSMKTLSVGSLC